jgi:hypothetical protein
MNDRKASEKPADDTIVLRLDEFPELEAALRCGDYVTARRICSQLFGLDSGATTPPRRPAAIPSPKRTCS